MSFRTDKIDYKLLFTFFATIIPIFVLSYLFPKGGLTADSKNYINLAQNILDGHWFFVKDFYAESGRSYFAVWPVGYSVLVAGISYLLHVDLFLATKLLNVFSIAVVFYCFKKFFGKDAYIFGGLFLIDSVVRLTYRSWVQTPFITGLVLLAFALYIIYHNKNYLKSVIAIVLIGFFIFQMRYIGLFVLAPIGLLGCYMFYNRDYKSFSALLVAGVLILLLAIGYLYINYQNTGYATGTHRINVDEDLAWMLKRLFSRGLEELKIPAIAGVMLYLGLKLKKLSPTKKVAATYEKVGSYWPFFLLVGGSYLIIIISLRFAFRFDDFGGRMFGPGTFLLIIALLDYLNSKSKLYPPYKLCLLIVLVGSFIYHGPVKLIKSVEDNKLSYTENLASIEKKYSSLKKNSIVLFGNYDLIYIADGIQPANPFPFYGDYVYGRKYDGDFKEDIGKDQSLKDYVAQRCKLGISAVYMDISRWRPKEHGGYKAVEDFIAENKGKEIVKIDDCIYL